MKTVSLGVKFEVFACFVESNYKIVRLTKEEFNFMKK